MATGGPTGQDPEKTRGSRGTDGPTRTQRITSTMAFRTYLGQIDAIALEFENERLGEEDAWRAWQQAKNLMVRYLVDNMHVRFDLIKEMRASGEAPPDDDQPSAVPG